MSLINQFDSDIYLVGSLDASECRCMRYPFCYFEVTGPKGERLDHPFSPGCGYVNPLRGKDFVRVAPGGKFDPYQKIDDQGFFHSIQICPRTFSSTGKYRVRFVYSASDGDISHWSGGSVVSDAKILSMFNRVPKIEVKSNEIAINVVAVGNQHAPPDPIQ